MPDFQSMIDSFNSPPTRHAMFVHLPIVLAMVGCVLALLAAILRKNTTLMVLAIACQALLVIAILATVNSGENAEHAISTRLAEPVNKLLHEHEEMAEKAWMFGAGVLVALFLAAIMPNAFGTVCAWLATLGAVASVAWIGNTAHLGGKLVYQHGVGTSHASITLTPATQPTQPAQSASTLPSRPGSASGAIASASVEQIAFFREQVYPLLSNRCLNCHNPDRVAAGKSGGLDQTSHEAMLKGGRNGPAIVPGKPDESLMVLRLRGAVPDKGVMPPRNPLSEESIAIIEQWIRDGAVWVEPSS